jgi:hypothetical protein
MSEIISVPLTIHVPPAAQLTRMRGMLLDLCDLLDRALVPAKRFMPDPGTPGNDVRLAVVLHGFNALESARAVQNLSGTDYAGAIAPHYRTLFEALVKIRWMRKHPKRARRFLESDPFERYALATNRVKKSKHWARIVSECKMAVEKNPDLLKLPDAVGRKSRRPNYSAIAKGMRMDLGDMVRSLGMDEEDYLIDHAVPSLTPHSSILHVSQYAKRKNSDGSVTISTEMDANMLLAYVSRAATRTGEVLNQILEIYPDGKIIFDSEEVARRLSDVTIMLRNTMRATTER